MAPYLFRHYGRKFAYDANISELNAKGTVRQNVNSTTVIATFRGMRIQVQLHQEEQTCK
jgi:hypothetical protein